MIGKRSLKKVFTCCRDRYNKMIYGENAPKYAETLWINPQKCNRVIIENSQNDIGYRSRMLSGKVINSAIPNRIKIPIMKRAPIYESYLHWKCNVSWEETGVYERMLDNIKSKGKGAKVWGCSTRNEIKTKLEIMDNIYEQIKRENKIRQMKCIDNTAFREEGGIMMHIDKSNKLILADGLHRFAAALVLEIDEIPIQVGVVHNSVISTLYRYRK